MTPRYPQLERNGCGWFLARNQLFSPLSHLWSLMRWFLSNQLTQGKPVRSEGTERFLLLKLLRYLEKPPYYTQELVTDPLFSSVVTTSGFVIEPRRLPGFPSRLMNTP